MKARALALILLLAGCAGSRRAVRPLEESTPVAAPVLAPNTLGTSVEGRPLQAETFGTGDRRIYLIGGIHGDERGGIENAERIALWLASQPPRGVTVRYLTDLNPDGTAARRRENAHGIDLNRNWPARNFTPAAERGPAPLSEPEAAAVYRDVIAFAPDVVLVLHAARRGPFVNFDGPARDLARAFADAAAVFDPRWHVQADMGYPTPGSLGSWLGLDLGVPILTIETDRAHGGDDCWSALRAGFARLFHGSRG